jgi:hypothetical protein
MLHNSYPIGHAAFTKTRTTDLFKDFCSKLNNNTKILRWVLESYHDDVAVGAFPPDEVGKNGKCIRKCCKKQNSIVLHFVFTLLSKQRVQENML